MPIALVDEFQAHCALSDQDKTKTIELLKAARKKDKSKTKQLLAASDAAHKDQVKQLQLRFEKELEQHLDFAQGLVADKVQCGMLRVFVTSTLMSPCRRRLHWRNDVTSW